MEKLEDLTKWHHVRIEQEKAAIARIERTYAERTKVFEMIGADPGDGSDWWITGIEDFDPKKLATFLREYRPTSQVDVCSSTKTYGTMDYHVSLQHSDTWAFKPVLGRNTRTYVAIRYVHEGRSINIRVNEQMSPTVKDVISSPTDRMVNSSERRRYLERHGCYPDGRYRPASTRFKSEYVGRMGEGGNAVYLGSGSTYVITDTFARKIINTLCEEEVV